MVGARPDSASTQGALANIAILAAMLTRLKRVIAVVLAAAILLAGSGFGDAFAAALEHSLGIESSLAPAPSEGGDASNNKCEHGCAGHLNVHLTTLTDAHPFPMPVGASSEQKANPVFCVLPSRPDSFFRPPRVSLA